MRVMNSFKQTIAIGLATGLFALWSPAWAQEEEAPPAPEARETTKKKAEPAKAPEKKQAPASEAAKAEGAAKPEGEEEIDVSDLAEEYWRPQKDELEVVQNKRFTKQGRVEATALYSFFQTHQYTDSTAWGLTLSYHFHERWAFEASRLQITNSESDFLTSVRKNYGFTPDFNNEISQSMGYFTWAPIYGKFAFLGQKISHFDLYVSGGAGVTETKGTGTEGQRFSYGYSFGNRLYVWKNLSIRIEYRVISYQDKIAQTQGAAAIRNGGPGFLTDDITRRNLVFGIGWMF